MLGTAGQAFRCVPHHLEHDNYCIILLSAECPSFISDCRSLPFLLLIFLWFKIIQRILKLRNKSFIVYCSPHQNHQGPLHCQDLKEPWLCVVSFFWLVVSWCKWNCPYFSQIVYIREWYTKGTNKITSRKWK